ncbi:MAG: hypothetical protein HYT31_04600 [Parcubacteria group bacterium]|nr:hypothetical protein [Parcubacteria group bacterium]
MSQAVAVAKRAGIELVLNGGKQAMDSPTIPVTWVFDDGAIAQQPVYLVFVEQHESESYGSFERPLPNAGRRYFCRVDRGVQFIPVFRPGLHRLAVLAFSEAEAKMAQVFLRPFTISRAYYNYAADIHWDDLEHGVAGRYRAIAATTVEFEVPEALFEPKPATRFSKLVWEWANWLHKREPRDKCEYRSRLTLAFTLKIPIGLLVLVGLATMFTIGILYSFIGPAVVFLAGFRPRSPFAVWEKFPGEGQCVVYRHSQYRLWNLYGPGGKRVYMPITPIEVIGLVGAPVLVWSLLFPWHTEPSWSGLLAAACFLVWLVALCVLVLRVQDRLRPALSARLQMWLRAERVQDAERVQAKARRAQERNARELEADQRRSAEYRQWLGEHYSTAHKPVAVDLAHIPPAHKGRAVQRLYVSFHALKARVCRPYAK